MNADIAIIYDERCGYSVKINGEVMLECLGADEVIDLTIGELIELGRRSQK